jgi:CheY-like chemotaxis protein
VNEPLTLLPNPRLIPPAATGLHRPGRILVIDDDAANRFLNALLLTRAGWRVETAADGESGWELLAGGEFDLVVTDLEMPRLSGLELVRRLRGTGMGLPVVVVSGALGAIDDEQSDALKLSAVLQKPLRPDELVAAAAGELDRLADDPPWPHAG